MIHTHSKRADKSLIEVNRSAIPESLFESEMFGYEAGPLLAAAPAKPASSK